MVTLKFCSGLDKVWSTGHALLALTARQIHSNAHLSYKKIFILHVITLYITEIRTFVVH